MPSRSSVLFLACVACSGSASTPPTPVASPAEVIPIPLTAATASIAAAQPLSQDVTPPWTLTASDGSGLLLTRVDAKAVFEGPLAYTELHLYFFNPEARVREGTFQITLPQKAAISRFAMENNGQWMEAEVVEKQLARRAYDDFLHRRQDPALLEKAAGNQFTAKVFPIDGKAEKHLVISYSQELPGAQYVLPLRGLPKTERVDVSLAITNTDGKTAQSLSERNWQPDRDFVSTVAGTAIAVNAGSLIAAQLEIGGQVAKQAPTGITLLVDTSASRALGYQAYVASIDRLARSLATTYGAELPLQLIAFDQDAEEIYSGRAGNLDSAALKKLIERGAAGASDLGQALAFVAQRQPRARVVVVTDGVITAGREGSELQQQVGKLAPAKVERIDFVLAGGLRDETAMTALVRSGLPHAGTVLDLERDPVAAALGEAVLLDVAIDVPGASWVYPRVIPTARAGTRAMVYAKLAQPAQTLDVKVGGIATRLALMAATVPLVERAAAGAEIAELEAKLATAKPDEKSAIKTAIATKSVAARVLSSQTSLLVLESDSDYARYGIDRKALADVLVIGAKGIERKNRPAPVLLAQPTKQRPNKNADKVTTESEPRDRDEAKEKSKDADDAKKKVDTSGVEQGEIGGVAGGMPGGVASASGASSGRPAASPPPPPSPEPAKPEPAPDAKPEAKLAEAPREDRPAPRPATISRPPSIESADADEEALSQEPREVWPPKDAPPALTGKLATITKLLKRKDVDGALAKARDWHAEEPGNVLALIALGDALEAKGSTVTAARVYGSIIDLFPGRADMRRFAGERLSRIHARAPELIVDTYRRAVADRPDHMTGHRLYAYALVRAGKHADAFTAILAGLDREFRDDSYAGGKRVLADDATMIGAAYAAAEPAKRDEVAKALRKRGLAIATKPSTRFILYWETDGNDVDFHIQDGKGGHAFYSNPQLPSGGELYADITTGYGPECFAIQGTPKAGPYRLSINYYSQGPMGYGMGLLSIQRFDGKGGLSFEDRPYVIMNDHAYVDLGSIR